MNRNSKLAIVGFVILAALGVAYFIMGKEQMDMDDAIPEMASTAEEETNPTAPSAQTSTAEAITLINSVSGAKVILTEAELLALPQATVNTENEFVDAMTAFTGPLGRDVLALVGEGGSTVVLTAVNDYAVEVPIEDFINYDVVFAMSADGERFSRRDKGPIWVVYPMSDNAELQDPVYNARLIWQLVKVEIK